MSSDKNMLTGEKSKRITRGGYYLALVIVILVWGVAPVVYSIYYEHYSASVLTSVCTFSSAIMFTVISAKKFKLLNRSYLRTALPIGVLNSVACLLQRIGLQYTTPARYSFLEHFSCVIVPFAVFLFVRKRPGVAQVASSLICLVGCFILSGMLTDSGGGFGIGELLCLMAGIIFGVCIAATGVFTDKLDISLYMMIQMWSYFAVSVISAVTLNFITVGGEPLERIAFSFDPWLVISLAVFGLLDIALCWLIRTEAIRHTDPTAVAIMVPFTAVITAVVSIICGMDTLSLGLIIGAVMILFAVLLNGIYDAAKSKDREQK